MVFPVFNGWFMALTGSDDRFLQTQPHLADQVSTMIGMITDPELSLDGHRQPSACPHVSGKPIGRCSFRQYLRDVGLLLCASNGVEPLGLDAL